MSNVITSERCILCERPTTAFAKSHVIPRSFYNRLPEITGVDVGKRFYYDVFDERGEKRTTHNGHYILDKICLDCEHRFLANYDDYAAQIYLQCKNEVDVEAHQLSQCKLHLIPAKDDKAIERKRLRAFWASLLWRFSVDVTTFTDFKLAESWENRIRLDMLTGNAFDYISVIPILFDNPAMANIDEPKYVSGAPSACSCTIKVRLPCFAAFIGLDRDMSFTQNTITNDNIQYSCSLDDKFQEYGYFFPEMDELIGERQSLAEERKIAMDRRDAKLAQKGK